MQMLVTLEEAREHLRVDSDDDAASIELQIKAVSLSIISLLGAAATFLDEDGNVVYDSAGNPVGVPENVKLATLVVLAMLYDGTYDELKLASDGLPVAASSLLYHAGRMPNLS